MADWREGFIENKKSLGIVQRNRTTGLLTANGETISLIDLYFNVKDYGAIGDGVADDTAAINSALAAISKAAVWNDPRIVEGGILYFPRGKYKITSTIDLSSGETLDFHRAYLTLQGDGMGASIIFSDTLKSMIVSTTASDRVSIKDLQVMSYATYTGVGTLEKLVSFTNCMYVLLERVRFYVRYPGRENYDCVLLYLGNCYYSAMTDCETFSFSVASSEKHNISYAANATYFGSTHIRTLDNNAFYITNHKWTNCFRAAHFINEDGLWVSGGSCEHYMQGFLFDNSEFNLVAGVRLEAWPNSLFQYKGSDDCYQVKFTEYSKYNRIIGNGYPVESNVKHYGYIDLNGSNAIDVNNIVGRSHRRTLIRNGNFAMGAYTDGTVKIPGWTSTGSPTLANELSDLPPESAIDRAISVTTTANAAGLRTTSITLDPERYPHLMWKFWMKRLSGDHSLRMMVYSPTGAVFLSNNLLVNTGVNLTQSATSVPITSATWSGGVLTVNTAVPNHFVKVGQRIVLSGFTSSGTALNNSYLCAGVTDDDTFTLTVAADPGTISVVGTFARTGIDDISNLDEWVEYKGVTTFRRGIVSFADSGANIVLTFDTTHLIPNSASVSVKLFGCSNDNYNTTHSVISTTATTVTIAKPVGADLVSVGSGDAALSGLDFFGWGGFFGSVFFQLGAELTSPSTTATHLVAGMVVKPVNGLLSVADDYLPGIEMLSAKKTFDWPSCAAFAAGSTQTTTVTVTGAAMGDMVTAGLSVNNSGLLVSAHVTSADTVTVTIFNTTVSSIDLSSGVLAVSVTHLY